MPRRHGLRPRLLATVLRSTATLAFAAERQVVGQTTNMRMRWIFLLSAVLWGVVLLHAGCQDNACSSCRPGSYPSDPSQSCSACCRVRMEEQTPAPVQLRCGVRPRTELAIFLRKGRTHCCPTGRCTRRRRERGARASTPSAFRVRASCANIAFSPSQVNGRSLARPADES